MSYCRHWWLPVLIGLVVFLGCHSSAQPQQDQDLFQDYNPCASNPCLNNGTCIKIKGTGTGRFRCMCTCGYYGSDCAISVCDERVHPCMYGDCFVRLDSCSAGCKCDWGYTGVNCTKDIDECTDTPNICGHRASCQNIFGNYMCHCNLGYTGSYDGYHDGECTPFDPCSASPCLSNATCMREGLTSFTCFCPDGYYGQQCELGPKMCDAVEVMRDCLPSFVLDIDWQTYSLKMSPASYVRACNQPVKMVLECIAKWYCKMPSNWNGWRRALVYLCSRKSEYGTFMKHEDCLRSAEADLDCFGVYPQLLPAAVLLQTGTNFPVAARDSNVSNVTDILYVNLAQHINIIKLATCHYNQVSARCGEEAGNWIKYFVLSLSNTIYKVLDIVYHPDGNGYTYIDDCDEFSTDSDLKLGCHSIHQCMALFDMMVAKIQYGVLGFDVREVVEICSHRPADYDNKCLPAIAQQTSVLDSLIFRVTSHVYSVLCGPGQKLYVSKHVECLKRVATSPQLLSCAYNMTTEFTDIYYMLDEHDAEPAKRETCYASVRYLNCLYGVLLTLCGNATARWQRNVTLHMLEIDAFDKTCLRKKLQNEPSCSLVAPEQRQPCGPIGITAQQCISQRCCYDKSGSPACFLKVNVQEEQHDVGKTSRSSRLKLSFGVLTLELFLLRTVLVDR